MAVNPTTVNASFAFIEAHSSTTAGADREARLAINFQSGASPAVPATTDVDLNSTNALFNGQGQTIQCSWRLSCRNNGGLVAATGKIGGGIFIFPDNQDGGGIATGKKLFVGLFSESVSFPAGAAWTGVDNASGISITMPNDGGSYKIVPVLFNLSANAAPTNANPPKSSQVVQGTTGVEKDDYYIDGDNNVNFSANAPLDTPALSIFVTGRVAWVRQVCLPQALTASISPHQKYPDQPTISLTINNANVINPKQVRLGLVATGAAASAALIHQQTVTPPTSGASVTSAAYNVDTLFSAAASNYRLRSAVGPTAGQSSTLTAEQPDVIANNTPSTGGGFPANDQAWIAFGTPAAGLSALDSYTLENTTNLSIGSGITVSGFGSFNDAYVTARSIFRRTGISDTSFAVPHLQCTITDAFGNTINSKNFTAQVIQGNAPGFTENTQNLSTNASGVLQWNYTVANSHTAFNRFKKSGADNPAGTPTLISGFPVYPKNVQVVGNAFGSGEPTSNVITTAFGVNSEYLYADMWTGPLSSATIAASGEPTGVVNRSQSLGTGSMRFKLCSAISGATGKVAVPGTENVRMVDGSTLNVQTGDHQLGEDCGWNLSAGSVEFNPGSATTLSQDPGYGNGSNNGFELLSTSGDPRSIDLIIGTSEVTATRNSLSISGAPDTIATPWTPGQTPTGGVGFTSDVGNYGYFVKRVAFTAVDANTILAAAIQKLQSSPVGTNLLLTATLSQLQPDNTLIGLAADAGSIRYYLWDQVGQNTANVLVNPGGSLLTSVQAATTFGGNSNSFLNNSGSPFLFDNTTGTFAGWFNSTYIGTQALFTKCPASFAGGYALWLNGSLVTWQTNSNSGANVLSRAVTSVWHHVVVWQDVTNNKIGMAIDGWTALNPAQLLTRTVTPTNSGFGNVFGTFGDFSSGFLNGSLQGWSRWNRVLTQSEINTLYNNGVALSFAQLPTALATDPSLLNWWEFNESSGNRNDSVDGFNFLPGSSVGSGPGQTVVNGAYQANLTVNSESAAKILVTATVNGSRITASGEVPLQKRIAEADVLFDNSTAGHSHLGANDPVTALPTGNAIGDRG